MALGKVVGLTSDIPAMMTPMDDKRPAFGVSFDRLSCVQCDKKPTTFIAVATNRTGKPADQDGDIVCGFIVGIFCAEHSPKSAATIK